MKRMTTTLFAALLSLAGATAASAVTTVYEASGTALVDAFDVLFIDPETVGTNISLSALVTGDTVSDAVLFVSTGSGEVLLDSITQISASITRVDGAADTVEIVFGDLMGQAEALFDTTATAILSFSDEDAVDGFGPATARIVSDLAPIPLPAALPLLVIGLASVAGVARRRA